MPIRVRHRYVAKVLDPLRPARHGHVGLKSHLGRGGLAPAHLPPVARFEGLERDPVRKVAGHRAAHVHPFQDPPCAPHVELSHPPRECQGPVPDGEVRPDRGAVVHIGERIAVREQERLMRCEVRHGVEAVEQTECRLAWRGLRKHGCALPELRQELRRGLISDVPAENGRLVLERFRQLAEPGDVAAAPRHHEHAVATAKLDILFQASDTC